MVLGPSPSPSPSSPSSSPSSCSSCTSSSVVAVPSLRASSFLHSAAISPPPSSSSSSSPSSSSSSSPAVTVSSLSRHGRASLQKLHSRRLHLLHPILNSSSSSSSSSSSLSRRSNTVFLPWSSFIFSSRSFSFIVHCRGLGQKSRAPSYSLLSVRADLGGQYEDNFADVDKHLLDYFTYKAVRTVLVQLYEMNPTEYAWFYNFVVNHKPQDSKLFLRTLVQEKQELCERVMVTRLHLYNKWIKKHDHSKMYQAISDQNLELLRERLVQTIKWADSENTDKI